KEIVLIPFENKPDLYEVDQTVKENVSFIPVEKITDVLDVALAKPNSDKEIFRSVWCENIEPVNPIVNQNATKQAELSN
ncbi:MAG: S16 family serine protease, partial [Oscillospiraceae bacterium]